MLRKLQLTLLCLMAITIGCLTDPLTQSIGPASEHDSEATMSEDYDGSDVAWIDHVRLVEDGEAASQAFLALGDQDLADRTAYLRKRVITDGAAIPLGGVSVTATGTIPGDVSCVEVAGRGAPVILTLPASAPIGRKIKIVEVAGQGDGLADAVHSITVAAPGGESIISVSGAPNPVMFDAYDRMTVEKVGATHWIAAIEPACTAAAATGTYYDNHLGRLVRVRPVIIGVSGHITTGAELSGAPYYPPTNTDLQYQIDGLAISDAPTGAGTRPGYMLDSTLIGNTSIRLTRGPKLKSVSITLQPTVGHGALPLLPKLAVRKYIPDLNTFDSMRTAGDIVSDTSATIGAYETQHDLTFICDRANRITPEAQYIIEFWGEGGADAAPGLLLRSIKLTYTE